MINVVRPWITARAVTVAVLLLGLFVGLAGTNTGWAQTQLVVVDDRGREIPVPQRVERVVVAGTPLFTEILVDINAEALLVGVTSSPDNPPEVVDVPKVGPSLEANVERIIELEPDVVFGAVFGVRESLESAGVIVITPVGFITSLTDIFTITRVVGQVVGRGINAELLIGQISEELVRVESAVAQLERPRAAFIFASGDNPPFAAGRGSVEGELLARAGAINIFSDIDGGTQVNVETLIERDPAFIFTDPSQISNLTDDPRLAEVTAIQEGNVIGVKASSLTSTRVADALRTLAEALHPGAFAAPAGAG